MSFDTMWSAGLGGQVAVITGAAGGIGSALCEVLADRGAQVVLADVDASRLAGLADGLRARGATVIEVTCDVTSDASVSALRDRVHAELGKVDLLFNNAGVLPALEPPETIDMSTWQRAIDVNLLGVVRGVQTFLPDMLRRRSGYIVNTASLAGLVPSDPDEVVYTATKWGVVGYTLGITASLRPRGVGVSCLVPGPARTSMLAHTRVPDGVAIIEPQVLAELVLEGIAARRVMIFSSEAHAKYVATVHADHERAVQQSIDVFGPR